MSAICLMDTSVFLNLLDVPNRNGERETVVDHFNKCVQRFAMSEVFIWSLDSDLTQYHRKPSHS